MSFFVGRVVPLSGLSGSLFRLSVVAAFWDASSIMEGPQQYGVCCDGRQIQVS